MAVDTDELRGLANDCAKDGLHTVAEQLRADADEIDRLRGAIRWHRLAAQEETGADLDDPMNFETFDRALWSVLSEDGDSNG